MTLAMPAIRPIAMRSCCGSIEPPFMLGDDVFAQASNAATLTPMLRRSAQLTGRQIKALLVDSGYVTGHDLADGATQDVRLYGPWKENDVSASKARAKSQVSKDDFEWHPELDVYQCPAGHPLKRAERERRGRRWGREVVVWRYRGEVTTCQASP